MEIKEHYHSMIEISIERQSPRRFYLRFRQRYPFLCARGAAFASKRWHVMGTTYLVFLAYYAVYLIAGRQ